MTQFVLPAVLTAGVLVLAVIILAGGNVLIRMSARLIPGPATAYKTIGVARIVRVARLVLRLLTLVAAVVVIASFWAVDVREWFFRGLGESLVSTFLRLALLLVGALTAFEVSGFAISHALSEMAARSGDARRRAQLNTLGPLLRGLAQSAIVLAASLMALSEIGIQIGPLLAGAGVVGVALGFGAQTLVKDLLTGFFLLVEDIVSVGDIVQVGQYGGQVEQMTLRTIRLRDFDGTLHVFPYGEAQVVHNLTKTFSYYVFDLQVSYSSDIDKALEVMQQIGEELRIDPVFADKILEPIDVVGVDSLADAGVVLKARFKTKPMQQWLVGREYNRRIKLAFDAAGVEITVPRMRVMLPEGQPSVPVRH